MKICKILLLGMALLLTACGRFEVSIEPIYSPTATGIVQAPVSTSTATVTLLPTEQLNPTATITIPSANNFPIAFVNQAITVGCYPIVDSAARMTDDLLIDAVDMFPVNI